tara:strand:- start:153 stop:464 length:312 start_codon:yes stop_codon:yes gene_type:complete
MTSEEIESKLVDLHTTSKKLEDLMLAEYSGKLFPEEQHFVSGRYDFKTDTTLYSFIGLNQNELLSYLPKVDKNIKDGWYSVYVSKSEDCLRAKLPNGKVRDFT